MELPRNGYAVLRDKWLEYFNIHIREQVVDETDFVEMDRCFLAGGGV